MHKIIYTLALLGLLQGVAAQQDYGIYLQSGAIPVAEGLPSDSMDPSALSAHQYGDYYYLVLQFSSLPTPIRLSELAALGITLHGYLPNYAYVARVPVQTDWNLVQARQALPLQARHKLSKALSEGNYPSQAVSSEGIIVQVYPYPEITLTDFAEGLKQSGFIGIIKGDGLLVTVPWCCLLDLAGHPAVMYLEAKEASPKAEGWGGRTAQRLNLLSSGPGLGWDGTGVSMSIGDDGKVSHEDFRGRLTDFNTTDIGNHGDMTAGLAMGAGNLNPLGMGMAPGAYLHLYPIDDYVHLNQAVANLQQRNVVITSTSYGEGCGGIYTSGAQQMDKQVFDNEALLHCFSAGNSGEEVCSSYSNVVAPDGGRYGTLTGGRKVAKNALTVGNVFQDDRVVVSSSRGPTADGRIKPDLCANGQGNLSTDTGNGYRSGGGTSAASPSLAGTAAALYQAYRAQHGGANPSAALIKAVLLNTAEDLGNRGPDYITGFGRVHAGRALELLQNNWFTTATVSNSAVQTHTIQVPQGVQQARVMLYWSDPEGLPNAAKALVNDLDMSLKTATGETYFPWVLSRIAQADSLNKPAYRGVDHVNNVEQITLETPEAGTYTITIKGNFVPKGPQKYLVVYCFVKEELKLTYPNGGEGFVPEETEVIHWDAVGNSGTFSLEYSTNGGSTWQTIASNIAGQLRHYEWKVPKISATKALVRVKRDGKSSTSAAPFCILELPDFQVTHATPSSALVSWNKVPGANSYEVYAMGSKYMEVIGTTADTSFVLNMTSGQSNWYSVRAKNTNGANGRRAFAKQYQHLSCDVKVTLQLTFDLYPGETFWDMKDATGKVWASGGPYVNASVHSSIELEICLPYGCYSLNMYDAYNDGMCCNYGQGSYRLLNSSGAVLASGSQFGNFKANPFCVQPNLTSNLNIQIASVQNVSCANAQNGAVTMTTSGGNGNYQYAWSTGSTGASISGLKAGTYSVTVSDGINQKTTNVIITQPPVLEVQLVTEQNNCLEENDASITAQVNGGTPPYKYNWNTGSITTALTNLPAGAYSLTLTDEQGCTQVATATVQNLNALTLNVNTTNPTCANNNDGAASALVSGGVPPYTYSWNNGSTKSSIANVSKGNYNLTVTDHKGCQMIASVNLIAPPPISLSFSATQAFGTNNGSINLSVSGGTPGYQYKWSNGAAIEDLQNLGPGTYIVTVTDAKGCTEIGSYRIDFQDFTNCITRGSNTRFEWIQSVQLGNFVNESGSNGGYANFESLMSIVRKGGSHSMVLIPGYISGAFSEYWRVWIDFNHDGDFIDSGEEVLAADGIAGGWSSTIQIPNNVLTGATNMRISMRYGSSPVSCGTFPYGEVEDYRIFINDNNANEEVALRSEHSETPAKSNLTLSDAVQIYPNPTKGRAVLQYAAQTEGNFLLQLYNMQGHLQYREMMPVQRGLNAIDLKMSDLPAGTYFLYGENEKDYFVKRIVIFK